MRLILYMNKMKSPISIIFLIAVIFSLFGEGLQASHDIKIKIENYESDTLLLGYYYWDKQYIKDTLIRNSGHTEAANPSDGRRENRDSCHLSNKHKNEPELGDGETKKSELRPVRNPVEEARERIEMLQLP